MEPAAHQVGGKHGRKGPLPRAWGLTVRLGQEDRVSQTQKVGAP